MPLCDHRDRGVARRTARAASARIAAEHVISASARWASHHSTECTCRLSGVDSQPRAGRPRWRGSSPPAARRAVRPARSPHARPASRGRAPRRGASRAAPVSAARSMAWPMPSVHATRSRSNSRCGGSSATRAPAPVRWWRRRGVGRRVGAGRAPCTAPRPRGRRAASAVASAWTCRPSPPTTTGGYSQDAISTRIAAGYRGKPLACGGATRAYCTAKRPCLGAAAASRSDSHPGAPTVTDPATNSAPDPDHGTQPFPENVVSLPRVVPAPDLTIRPSARRASARPWSTSSTAHQTNEHYVDEDDRVLFDDTVSGISSRGVPPEELPGFEPGGPRRKIFFDPSKTRVGIVTCGGLCPGLNDVIRALVHGAELPLRRHDGSTASATATRGSSPSTSGRVLDLTPDVVSRINEHGGTILGTSRGEQDPVEIVDCLERMSINVLFVIGGDGTIRGALQIAREVAERGLRRSPSSASRRRSTTTSCSSTRASASRPRSRWRPSRSAAAHVEAKASPNGVGLVKLMGRHSGFIACYASLRQERRQLRADPRGAVRARRRGRAARRASGGGSSSAGTRSSWSPRGPGRT